MNKTMLAKILTACYQNKLLLGCRSVGREILTVAAMGDRSDVLYDCQELLNCKHVANGVEWYFSISWSWGFARGGDSVTRNSCDTEIVNSPFRLCWHTHVIGGFRCGTFTGLNSNLLWERVIYQRA
jgi:hypothetical protein